MPRRIALSDIHGCSRTFLALLDRLAFSRSDTLFLLGDYINRGPDSRGVIDTIWRLQREGYAVHCLTGNHEYETLQACRAESPDGPPAGENKFRESFGVRRLSEVPRAYFDWMDALPRYFELPGYVLVHAGLHFGPADPFTESRDLLYIRDWYDTIDGDWLAGRVIVHGHTPQPAKATQRQLAGLAGVPAICIDCGCAVAKAPLNQLCAFDLTNRTLVFQENVEGTG